MGEATLENISPSCKEYISHNMGIYSYHGGDKGRRLFEG
jgi:hypothetical protein